MVLNLEYITTIRLYIRKSICWSDVIFKEKETKISVNNSDPAIIKSSKQLQAKP